MAPKHKPSEMPVAEPDAPETGAPFSDFCFPFGDDSASWKQIRKAAAAQLDRMLRLVPKLLRSDEPRHIHDFRVATRRFQQAFDLLGPRPRSSSAARHRRKIKRARRAFSEVRNCDVLIDRVEAVLAGRSARYRRVWIALVEYLRDRRSSARDRALRKLTKLNLGKVYVQLQSVIAGEAPPRKTNGEMETFPGRAEDFMVKARLIEELENKWSRFQADLGRSQQSPDGRSIHQARIAGKKLRYLIEIMRTLEIPGCGEALAWLQKLQQYLGDWHDLEVSEQMIVEMLARPQFVRDHLDVAAETLRLIARERKAKTALATRYGEMGLAAGGGASLQSWVDTMLARARPES